MRKLIECKINNSIYGLDVVHPKDFNVVVFREKLGNVCGFKKYVPFFYLEETRTHYYEVSYFAQLLYEGDKTAFEVLNCPGDNIYGSDLLFDYFVDERDQFVSRALVNNLLSSAKISHKRLKRSSSLAPISLTEVKFVNYDRFEAFDAHLNLRLGLDAAQFNKFVVGREDVLYLEGILEGRFKYRTLEKEFREKNREIRDRIKKYGLKDRPNINLLNEIVLNIRDESRRIF